MAVAVPTHFDATGLHVHFVMKVLLEPLVAVALAGDQMVKGQGLFPAAEGAAGAVIIGFGHIHSGKKPFLPD